MVEKLNVVFRVTQTGFGDVKLSRRWRYGCRSSVLWRRVDVEVFANVLEKHLLTIVRTVMPHYCTAFNPKNDFPFVEEVQRTSCAHFNTDIRYKWSRSSDRPMSRTLEPWPEGTANCVIQPGSEGDHACVPTANLTCPLRRVHFWRV
jgi:hypothetical protein